MIDSPVYPDELDALPVLLDQAGFGFSGLLATHGDWDHLLGRLAFPGRVARRGGDDGRAPARRAGRDPARAARLRRAPLRRAAGAALARAGRGAAGARVLRAGRGGARAAPGRRAHRRRDRRLGALGAGARLRGLPLAGRDPDRRGVGRRRISRRWPGWRGSSRVPTGSCPGTESRSTRLGPRRSCARTGPTSRGCATIRAGWRCRSCAAAASSGGCTRLTSPVSGSTSRESPERARHRRLLRSRHPASS